MKLKVQPQQQQQQQQQPKTNKPLKLNLKFNENKQKFINYINKGWKATKLTIIGTSVILFCGHGLRIHHKFTTSEMFKVNNPAYDSIGSVYQYMHELEKSYLLRLPFTEQADYYKNVNNYSLPLGNIIGRFEDNNINQPNMFSATLEMYHWAMIPSNSMLINKKRFKQLTYVDYDDLTLPEKANATSKYVAERYMEIINSLNKEQLTKLYELKETEANNIILALFVRPENVNWSSDQPIVTPYNLKIEFVPGNLDEQSKLITSKKYNGIKDYNSKLIHKLAKILIVDYGFDEGMKQFTLIMHNFTKNNLNETLIIIKNEINYALKRGSESAKRDLITLSKNTNQGINNVLDTLVENIDEARHAKEKKVSFFNSKKIDKKYYIQPPEGIRSIGGKVSPALITSLKNSRKVANNLAIEHDIEDELVKSNIILAIFMTNQKEVEDALNKTNNKKEFINHLKYSTRNIVRRMESNVLSKDPGQLILCTDGTRIFINYEIFYEPSYDFPIKKITKTYKQNNKQNNKQNDERNIKTIINDVPVNFGHLDTWATNTITRLKNDSSTSSIITHMEKNGINLKELIITTIISEHTSHKQIWNKSKTKQYLPGQYNIERISGIWIRDKQYHDKNSKHTYEIIKTLFKIKSYTGARGIGQMTSGAYKDIYRIFKLKNKKPPLNNNNIIQYSENVNQVAFQPEIGIELLALHHIMRYNEPIYTKKIQSYQNQGILNNGGELSDWLQVTYNAGAIAIWAVDQSIANKTTWQQELKKICDNPSKCAKKGYNSEAWGYYLKAKYTREYFQHLRNDNI